MNALYMNALDINELRLLPAEREVWVLPWSTRCSIKALSIGLQCLI